MPLIITSTVKFDLTQNPPKLVFQDNTNHVLITTGVLRIKGPSGVFHLNTNHAAPDTNSSNSFTKSISLPLDVNGKVQEGVYEVDYETKTSTGVVTTAIQKVFNASIPKPIVKINTEVNCIASKLKSIDATDYGANVTSLSRTHTVKHPALITPSVADIVSSNAEVVASPIYTKTYVSHILSNVLYTQADGLQILISVAGSDDTEVVCDKDICCISDCMKQMVDAYNTALCDNPTEAERLHKKLSKLTAHYMLYSVYMQCGDESKMIAQLDAMKDIIGKEDCGCCDEGSDDELPKLVTSILGVLPGGVAPTYNLTTCTNGISVTPSQTGSTVTWQLCLDLPLLVENIESDIVDILTQNITTIVQRVSGDIVNVVSGSGNVTVTPSTVGGVLTFTIEVATPTTPNASGINVTNNIDPECTISRLNDSVEGYLQGLLIYACATKSIVNTHTNQILDLQSDLTTTQADVQNNSSFINGLQGAWTELPYSASYMDSASGTWTIASEANWNVSYRQVGKTLLINFRIINGVIATGGTGTAYLRIKLGAIFSFKTGKRFVSNGYGINGAGNDFATLIRANGLANEIVIYKLDTAAAAGDFGVWSDSAGGQDIEGQLMIELN